MQKKLEMSRNFGAAASVLVVGAYFFLGAIAGYEASEQSLREEILVSATNGDHQLIARGMLWVGADVNYKQGIALTRAAEQGHTSLVQMLIAAGADVHAHEEEALMQAVALGHPAVVQILVDAGADIDIWTDAPLRTAIENGHSEVVHILLGEGAITGLDDNRRKELRDFAVQLGRNDIAHMMDRYDGAIFEPPSPKIP